MWSARANFEPVTNREDFAIEFQMLDDDTGEALDLTGMTFVCELRPMRPSAGILTGDAYAPLYDVGNYSGSRYSLRLTTDSGIVLGDDGIVTINVTLDQSRSLSPGTYEVAATYTTADNAHTRQILLGYLPVYFGGVS